jgi:hypothetical protein
MAAGAVAFFAKPIDRVALLAAVRGVLGEDAGNKPSPPA